MIPSSQIANWHIVQIGMPVWARKTRDGDWYPAEVIAMSKRCIRVLFASGRRSRQSYAEIALRNPAKKAGDKPE